MHRAVCLLLASLSFTALGQSKPKDLQPLPEPPPPPEGISEDDSKPARDAVRTPPHDAQVTVIQRGDTTIEEYRVKGRLTSAKVTPKHGVPYYINYRNDPLSPREQKPEELRVPMWRIGNF
jgi:Protein of unknown function (DUF2782)